jgi:F0F1-type ATP synthase delta subunit
MGKQHKNINALAKTLNEVMKEQEIPSNQRIEVIKNIFEQFGVKMSKKFIKKI